jgi:alpha-galactosidase
MSRDGIDAWQKPLSGNRVAIAFLNRNTAEQKVTVTFRDVELDPEAEYTVYDVWTHSDVKRERGKLSAVLKTHECQVFVLTPLPHKQE